MDRNNPFYAQIQLLIRVLPFVAQESCFALKGSVSIQIELSPILRGTVFPVQLLSVCEPV